MASKESVVDTMVEQINIQSRQATVQNKGDLVELEKALLQAQPAYNHMCSGIVDALIARGMISVD
jgi:hypothetical protein